MIQKFTRSHLMHMELEQTTLPGALNAATGIRRARQLAMPNREDAKFGIWEASVGSFVREVVAGELMFILSGSATFVAENGESIEMSEGDTFVFPPNTRGVWNVLSDLRKLYVLF